MRRSNFRLRALRAVTLFTLGVSASSSLAAGPMPQWPIPKPNSIPSVSAASLPYQEEEMTPLGGPVAPLGKSPQIPVVTSNAATKPPTVTPPDNKPTGTSPAYPGVTFSDATEQTTVAGQPPAALGPAPYDLGLIKKLQVGNQSVPQAPLRVGNLDILAPLVDQMPILGATVTRADPKNVPGGYSGPSDAQYFQINVPTGAPIVLTVGKSSAWIDNNEQPLRAAPLVIGQQIYLPIFSIAPLLGAAARLDDQGTLVLTPTIQSVELFPIRGSVAVTIKTSAPVPDGVAKIVQVKATSGNSPKVFIDFPGYSMGFDAGNSTIERLVAPGTGDVLRARAGMPSKFPDCTRIVLDLKKPLAGMPQDVPDKTLYALVLLERGESAPRITPPTLEPPMAPQPQGALTSIVTPGSSSLRGLTIVVDAGHGGHDTGAQGSRSLEKSHTLDIAKRLQRYLGARGANVLMTRDTDNFISLQGRVDFANQRHADMFVSVHINASVNRGSTGTETFYYTAFSQGLAREVQKELLKATGRPNRGIAQARFYVVRKTWMPSILTESAFITNSKEEALLCDPNYRERLARGIAQGISNYVSIYGRPGNVGISQ